MIKVAALTFALALSINHHCFTQEQERFLPYGYYSIEGEVPAAFKEIDTIQHWLPRQESSGPDVSERLAGVHVLGGVRYRFTMIKANRKGFSFTTRKVKGVHYSFSGRFLRTDFVNDELTEERAVAKGTLVKFKNGVRVARATILLSFFSGT